LNFGVPLPKRNDFKNMSLHSIKIALHGLNEIEITDCNEIIYCKAEGNYTWVYTTQTSFLVTKVLKHFESILPKSIFIRIHKSYLINVNYISGFDHRKVIIIDSKIELPIARRRSSLILKKISRHLLS
jgi:two-component system, LytTR family, response regulator